MNIKEILKQADTSGILTEETLTAIETAFVSSVDSESQRRSEKMVQEALEEQNKDHGIKLARMLKTLDEDVSEKMKEAMAILDKDRLAKLKSVVEHYKGKIKGFRQLALEHKNSLNKQISDYLDGIISECIPTQIFEEAAKNTYAQTILEQVKNVAMVSDVASDTAVRTVLENKTSKIQTLTEELETLKRKNEIAKIKKLVSEKTANFPTDMKKFVHERIKGKSLEYIKENIDLISKLYGAKTRREKSALLRESRKIVPSVDHTPQKGNGELVLESKQINNEPGVNGDPIMDYYISGLKGRE